MFFNKTKAPEGPPRPRLVLRVGVTGKRAIPAAEVERIGGALAHVFRALGDFLAECKSGDPGFFSDEQPPLVRIMSAMAEGADQLAAQAAIDLYMSEPKPGPVETRLAAILPFAQDEYEKDFGEDPATKQKRGADEVQPIIDRFRAMLKSPAVESVLEIDDEGLLATGKADDRNQAYISLRDALLEHTDILVAVTDNIDGGAGGTVDVIRLAVNSGIPVIGISTASHAIHLMRAADINDVSRNPRPGAEFSPDGPIPPELSVALEHVLLPIWEMSEDEAADAHGHAHHKSRPGSLRVQHYLTEEIRNIRPPWVFRAVRDALTVWPRRQARPHGFLARLRDRAGMPSRGLAATRAGVKAFFAAKKNYKLVTPASNLADLTAAWSAPATVRADAPRFGTIHASRYAWADALAIRYADRTRSAYIMIPFLGAMAVFVGLLAVFIVDHAFTPLKILLLFVEGALLLLAGGWLFRPAHHHSWHERMVEYRMLAELLRHQRFVYAFGGAERLERTVDQRGPDAWVAWYARSTLRELGMPWVRLSAPYREEAIRAFQTQELKEQLEYNTRLEQRFNLIDDRLGWVIQRAWIFAGGFALIGGLLVWLLYYLDHHGHHWAHAPLDWLKPFLTITMAFLPAAIAAIHGVRFQMEFKNTADRATATEKSLRKLDIELKERLEKGSPSRRACMYFVGEANRAMVIDVSGWATVYRGKAAEPPG